MPEWQRVEGFLPFPKPLPRLFPEFRGRTCARCGKRITVQVTSPDSVVLTPSAEAHLREHGWKGEAL